jgi:hypothetical protein
LFASRLFPDPYSVSGLPENYGSKEYEEIFFHTRIVADEFLQRGGIAFNRNGPAAESQAREKRRELGAMARP